MCWLTFIKLKHLGHQPVVSRCCHICNPPWTPTEPHTGHPDLIMSSSAGMSTVVLQNCKNSMFGTFRKNATNASLLVMRSNWGLSTKTDPLYFLRVLPTQSMNWWQTLSNRINCSTDSSLNIKPKMWSHKTWCLPMETWLSASLIVFVSRISALLVAIPPQFAVKDTNNWFENTCQ